MLHASPDSGIGSGACFRWLLRPGGGFPPQANSWYEIRSATKDVPLPFRAVANADGGFYSALIVFVVKHGNGEWYWVEFDRIANPENAKAPAVITKRRAWLNIGEATLILPAAAPDYKKAYPQGFQIVPAT